MNVDLLIACLIGFFALWGALSGVAKQVAHLASVVLAYLLARPLASYLGPHMARAFHVPPIVGLAAATLAGFILIVVAVRLIATPLLRRLLAGRTPEDRSLDRGLGFLFGGLKVALFAYVVLCCLTFVEDNISVAGRRLGLSPKDSVCFSLARKYNVVTLAHFAPVEDLVRVANAASDPQRLVRLEQSGAYRALRKDPRFRDALNEQGLRRAFQTGDVEALLRNSGILALVQDPAMAEKLRAAADASN